MPRTHTPEDLQRGIQALATTGGNSNRARDELERQGHPISERTLRYWNLKHADAIRAETQAQWDQRRPHRDSLIAQQIAQLSLNEATTIFELHAAPYRRAFRDALNTGSLHIPTLEPPDPNSIPPTRDYTRQQVAHALQTIARWNGNVSVAAEQLALQNQPIPRRTLNEWRERHQHTIHQYMSQELPPQIPTLNNILRITNAKAVIAAHEQSLNHLQKAIKPLDTNSGNTPE